MSKRRFLLIMVSCFFLILVLGAAADAQKKPALNKWKPAFDPKGAKYKCIVSNVGHPVMRGTFAGFVIRDELWRRTNGRIYFDFKPLSVLGGEVEVMNMLQMGAVQGMAVSSVASTNLGPRFGLVNLPFLIDSFDKLDAFIESGKLFDHYMRAMEHQGIMGLDITGYGNYGWATTKAVKSIADAKKVKFRIAEAAVNQKTYRAWGFNPVVMPWPDVAVALKQGVITGLDHTPIVCYVTKKFEVAKYYTQLNYAQGLFIWIFNRAWFERLPEDLQKIFVEVIHDVARKAREETRRQEEDSIRAAGEKAGVTFYRLPDEEMSRLRRQADSVYRKYAPEINKLYSHDSYRSKDFLKEVEDFIEKMP